jgi:hypothetical protein
MPTISPSGRAARRSQDSRDYDDRFMLQLDLAAREKLQALADHCAISQAAVTRQLTAQAQPKAFPEGWQRAVAER